MFKDVDPCYLRTGYAGFMILVLLNYLKGIDLGQYGSLQTNIYQIKKICLYFWSAPLFIYLSEFIFFLFIVQRLSNHGNDLCAFSIPIQIFILNRAFT